MEVNYLGALWTTRAVLPGMRERGRGHVMQVTVRSDIWGAWYNLAVIDEARRPWTTWRILAVVGTILLLAGFVWFWWQGVPTLYRTAGSDENARLNAVTTTRAALLALFVGLGALGTFWLNSRVYRITARTFELTERGHLTDRYAKGIEQLGNDNLYVRLGGIYALEQIFRDSPRERDQATIVEVLSAFVRVHSDPLYQYKAAQVTEVQWSLVPIEEQRRQAIEYVEQLDRLPVDVQTAVTVLGRLPDLPLDRSKSAPVAELSGAWLRRANLPRAYLTEADLRDADLTRANFSVAQLILANLTGANLNRPGIARGSGQATSPRWATESA